MRSFQLRTKFSNVGKRFVKLGLVWTVAAQLEVHVPCGFDDSDRKLQQLEPHGVNPILSHGLRQGQPPEPVEEIIRQRVNLNPVGVDDHGRAANIKIFVAFQRSTCYNSHGTSLPLVYCLYDNCIIPKLKSLFHTFQALSFG